MSGKIIFENFLNRDEIKRIKEGDNSRRGRMTERNGGKEMEREERMVALRKLRAGKVSGINLNKEEMLRIRE